MAVRKVVVARRRLSDQLAPALALLALLGIGAYALIGPTGILAWIDNRHALTERRAELKLLDERRAALRNRSALLDPAHVDPDLAGELIRKELNVAAPDEVVVPLK